jgi:2-polyprenyl-3-methyl-5-hydroxy-6-metoxy-1,4-benzoquinol methylase
MLKHLLAKIRENFTTCGVSSSKSPTSVSAQANPFEVGLYDASLSGLRNTDTGEFAENFRICAEDILLDAGCGAGGEASFAASTGAHIILMDIDKDKVEESYQRLKNSRARQVDTLVCDANPIALPDSSVTKVISKEVIEHVDDPAQFLSELVRVGKPGASYLLSCPAPESEQLQKGIAPDFYFQKPHHIRIIGRKEFEQLVIDAGLELQSHIYHGAFWTVWWMLYWTYEKDLNPPWHSSTDSWTKFWNGLQQDEGGRLIKAALDQKIPKSQIIVARKPY